MLEILDIEDLLPIEAIQDICQSGDNEEACNRWAKQIRLRIRKSEAVKILKQYGSWTEIELEEKSLRELKTMLVWIAAWNIQEGITL